MLVSIIIPVYNVEKYLSECIESILNQTYKNTEILLIDDGSTDSSGDICERYASEFAKISVIHKQNEGLGMARNTGLDIADGEYVFFMDSDDYLGTNHIKNMISSIIKNDTNACLAGFISIDNEKKVLRRRTYSEEVFLGSQVREKLLPRMICSSPNYDDSIEMSASGNLYSLKVIKDHNIRFCSERQLISEDLVFNIDYMQHCEGIITLSRTEYFYRKNPCSLSQAYMYDRFERSKVFYIEMSKKLLNLGYGKDTINRLKKMYFINLKMCISQETRSKKEYSLKERINKIKAICKDIQVKDAINTYPTKLLGKNQRLFLYLMKKEHSVLLFLIMKVVR